jgi:hypothetical protein
LACCSLETNAVKRGAGAVATLLAWPAACYIRWQRDRLSDSATALSADSKARLRPYFAATDLDRVRVFATDRLPLPALPFRQAARRIGLEFLDRTQIAAITFDYLIASQQPLRPRLLFHELVHVVQFRLLGVTGFARLYTRGFLAGGSYLGIPLERCARELECRFDSDRAPFNVASEVAAWIEADRYNCP